MKINNYMSCLPVWLFLIPCFCYGAELTISVQFPDKTPGVGIKVQQVQLARYGIHNKLLGVTDDNGRIKVQFQERRNTQSRFGYGVHRFVIMPEKYKWDVSDLFYWNIDSDDKEELRLKGIRPLDSYKRRLSNPNSNWSIGKLIKVRNDDRLEWKVILDKGTNVEVKVIDQFKEPVRNRIFSVSLDLGALSHTGFGGEIPMFKIQTGEKGCFKLSNVADFFYSFDIGDHHHHLNLKNQYIYCAPNAHFWTGIVKTFLKRKQEEVIYHRCIPKNVTFVVTDKKTGGFITNAQICQVKLFPTCRQGGPWGYTDVNGEYISRKFYTEHVVQFGVAKEGYETYLLDIKEFVSGKIFHIALESQSEKKNSSNEKE